MLDDDAFVVEEIEDVSRVVAEEEQELAEPKKGMIFDGTDDFFSQSSLELPYSATTEPSLKHPRSRPSGSNRHRLRPYRARKNRGPHLKVHRRNGQVELVQDVLLTVRMLQVAVVVKAAVA
ncbi:hypothetical protein ACP70R_021145 [Stipagrostis hirtigluma subsp. patula]